MYSCQTQLHNRWAFYDWLCHIACLYVVKPDKKKHAELKTPLGKCEITAEQKEEIKEQANLKTHDSKLIT